jgi:hypothetical protein
MFMAWEMAIFRAKVMLVVTTKTYVCLQYKKSQWLPDNHLWLQQPNSKWLQLRQMESCYVNINIVYTIGRMNGYRIVVIDGYDRLRTKCHRAAKIATA